MSELRVEDFRAYFIELYGYAPFPWQQRLLREVSAGRWPDLLDLPTGTGKTAAIDVALFHLALEAGDAKGRRAPVRIIYLVDRRTVVTQAAERARHIAKSLEAALKADGDSVLRRVAGRLRELSGDDQGALLQVAELRGGIPREESWARSPAQPAVVVSTVDQVGSRLLMRGYGVSDSMRPVHAGLLGQDALFLLDEVHLSQPLCETLKEVQRYQGWAERTLPERWRFMRMSATASDEELSRFRLEAEDREDPVLQRRLRARKPITRLEEVKVSGDDAARQATFARVLAEAAVPHCTPGRTVAVVVNRVETARAVFVAAGARLGAAAKVVLLTGRMRPYDRAALEEDLRPRIVAGAKVAADAQPLLLVATQCIEAGADFDFDVVITECAALDALLQRFGRLNRLGQKDGALGHIFCRADADEDDPIYGGALRATWELLTGLAPLDFGLATQEALFPKGEARTKYLAVKAAAPVLLPAHLDAWAQTAPVPEPDPDVALWLHGPQRGAPEVQIIWRGDFSEDMRESLEASPPSSAEALSLPLYAAARWLSRQPRAAAFGDVEGAPVTEAEDNTETRRPALRWCGADHKETRLLGDGDDLRPGDTLVVPASYGGLTAGNWAPESETPVQDVGDAVNCRRGRFVLRLHNAVLGPALKQALGDESAAQRLLDARPRSVGAEDDEQDPDDPLKGWLTQVAEALPKGAGDGSWLSEVLARLQDNSRVVPGAGEGDAYLAVVPRKRRKGEADEVSTEDDGGSVTGVAMPLHWHLRGVGAYARRFAARCGLPREIEAALEMAGRWHDAGKADRRFQVMLHGGSSLRAELSHELLAKSAQRRGDWEAQRRARERSGYPRGTRHEVMSVALLAESPLRAEAEERGVDFDLVLHLVAAHHGHCRPLAPVPAESEAITVEYTDPERKMTLRASSGHGLARLDSGVCERFWRVQQRYGWFGLAYLEALLRLADHRRSEAEQRGEREP